MVYSFVHDVAAKHGQQRMAFDGGGDTIRGNDVGSRPQPARMMANAW